MASIRAALLLALLVLLSSLLPIYAHHGNAIYDMKHTVNLTGRVTQLTLANPHCFRREKRSGQCRPLGCRVRRPARTKGTGMDRRYSQAGRPNQSPYPSQKRWRSRRHCREDNFLRRWSPGATKPAERPARFGSRHPLVEASG
jgi:hypothetical protein